MKNVGGEIFKVRLVDDIDTGFMEVDILNDIKLEKKKIMQMS